MKNQIAEIEKLKEALKIARKAMDKASMMYFRDLEGIDKMVAEQDDLIERTLKEQQLDDLANGTLQTHFKVVELQAENERLKEALRKHKHTDECWKYAVKTALNCGSYFCIAKCRDSYDQALKGE